MENWKYARWSAPIVAIVFVDRFIAASQRELGAIDGRTRLGMSLGMGLLSGLVLFILDVPPVVEPKTPTKTDGILANVAIGFCWFPILGLVLAIPAFLKNRYVDGWQNRRSRLALGLALAMTSIYFIIVFADLR